mmetsp:Transcript_13647/g.27957  ORF Transcript_13647/g.27957 Transcript_13647/m.27957 type:complete len:165 (+) Transcript_13647:483-977(+)
MTVLPAPGKYRRISRSGSTEGENPTTPPTNQIRVTASGKIRAYVTYAIGILGEEPEGVVLLGLGNAINKAVTVAELIKRTWEESRALHQTTELSSVEIQDHWEPLEDGLPPLTTTRVVSCITIRLCSYEGTLDRSVPGYQRSSTSIQSLPGTSRRADNDQESHA